MSDIAYRHVAVDELPTATDLRWHMTHEIDDTDLDKEYPGWRWRFIEFYRRRMEQGAAAFFFAYDGEQAVGMAAGYLLVNHRSEIQGQKSAYITSVYVVPPWRRCGVATTLTQMAIDWAKSRGCVVIRLRASVMGRYVYTAMGFQPTEEMEMRLA